MLASRKQKGEEMFKGQPSTMRVHRQQLIMTGLVHCTAVLVVLLVGALVCRPLDRLCTFVVTLYDSLMILNDMIFTSILYIVEVQRLCTM